MNNFMRLGYDSEQNGDPKLEEHMENEDGTAT